MFTTLVMDLQHNKKFHECLLSSERLEFLLNGILLEEVMENDRVVVLGDH